MSGERVPVPPMVPGAEPGVAEPSGCDADGRPRAASAGAGRAPGQAPAIAAALARLEPIDLRDVGVACLLDRCDTRFLLPRAAVPDVLARCAPDYRVLEVQGQRFCRYATVYFDTPDLACYHAHHRGRLPRTKVRVRSYLDTDRHYLEVKHRTNKGRTVKRRVRLESGDVDPGARLREDARLAGDGVAAMAGLEPMACARYTRITLVSRVAAERVTIDCDLELESGGRRTGFPLIAIAEVKQERSGASPFRRLMKALGRREGGISKYCLAILTLNDAARKNRFRRTLHFIEKAGAEHVLAASDR